MDIIFYVKVYDTDNIRDTAMVQLGTNKFIKNFCMNATSHNNNLIIIFLFILFYSLNCKYEIS